MAPWGPSLGKDPQKRALLRFHEEAVSRRVLVILIETENAALLAFFPLAVRGETKSVFSGKG